MKLNLPNKLTLLRIIAIPFFMFFILFPVLGKVWSPIVAAALFGLTSLTDMLDGKIARARGLITDFGKFLDPLADKMLVFGGYIAILGAPAFRGSDCEKDIFVKVFAWGVFIMLLREFAVSGMRMVVSSKANIVIAANWLGKIKTTIQMIGMVVILLEPIVYEIWGLNTHNIASYVFFCGAVIMTVWSGISYFKAYWPHLNPNK